MEQVRLCAVWPTENWLASSMNHIQVWVTVCERYCHALETRCLFEVAVINPEAPSASAVMEEVRRFMIATFYREAVVPLALDMTADNDEMRSILKKETDMFLNSGMSCTIRKSDTNELIGCTFFTTWKRDDDYEIVKETSLDWWHNTAADIAMQENPECPQGIWRNYQYQHLYNLAQKRLRNSERKFCLYVGPTYLNPDMRGKQILQFFMYDMMAAVFANGGSFLDCITTQSIHRGAKPSWGEYYNLLDTMAYEDQKLKANGINVLKELSKYNSIYLIGT